MDSVTTIGLVTRRWSDNGQYLTSHYATRAITLLFPPMPNREERRKLCEDFRQEREELRQGIRAETAASEVWMTSNENNEEAECMREA